MGLTTERKVFFGLMLIAGASLVVDQTVLSPSSASADSLGVDQVNLLPNESVIAGVAEPVVTSVTAILNDRLQNAGQSAAADSGGIDLQQMFSKISEAQADPDPVETAQTPHLRTEFINPAPASDVPSDLPSLSAVMPSRAGKSGAILNSKLYRIDQITDSGYRLVRVEQRQVLVERKGREFWIDLPSFDN